MKSFVVVLLFIVSFDLLACVIPIHDEQYDSLIQIEKVGKNQYKVSVPREVENRKNPTILLASTDEPFGAVFIAKKQKDLSVMHNGHESIAYFDLTEGDSGKYYIRVIWPIECCLCSVNAHSNIIEYED